MLPPCNVGRSTGDDLQFVAAMLAFSAVLARLKALSFRWLNNHAALVALR